MRAHYFKNVFKFNESAKLTFIDLLHSKTPQFIEEIQNGIDRKPVIFSFKGGRGGLLRRV